MTGFESSPPINIKQSLHKIAFQASAIFLYTIRLLVTKIRNTHDLRLVMRKPAFCICENKDADQLRGNRKADQHLCFRYMDSSIPLLPKSEISSL